MLLCIRDLTLPRGTLPALPATRALPQNNGLSFNGLSFNGRNINGLSFNGRSMNGLSFNGSERDGAGDEIRNLAMAGHPVFPLVVIWP